MIKNKMLPKYASSILQNLLEYVNKKFVWHWMSKAWKYWSLIEKKIYIYIYIYSLKHCKTKQSCPWERKKRKNEEREMTNFFL
jgi:hypothetical protein